MKSRMNYFFFLPNPHISHTANTTSKINHQKNRSSPAASSTNRNKGGNSKIKSRTRTAMPASFKNKAARGFMELSL